MTYAVDRFRLPGWSLALAALVSIALVLMATSVPERSTGLGSASSATPGPLPAQQSDGGASPDLAAAAARNPGRRVEVIVQLRPGATAGPAGLLEGRRAQLVSELPIIDGFAARLPAAAAADLADEPAVRAVSLNARVVGQARAGGRLDADDLATAFNQSIRADKAWDDGYTGRGVGVAVIDTGIRGDVPDFGSRVVASAVVNPAAEDAGDNYGHGTHIAGLIAGDGSLRASRDPLDGRYAGVAPRANLISVKADDGHGATTVLDVIDGLQFVLDHRDEYDIEVVNLSLRSARAESYRTDPLDAAVESLWFNGVTVVAAAGNLGDADDAVQYAPANDPFVITVGGVDDMGTKTVRDDRLAAWSSRGVTQDGFAKPDVLAPGARLVSTLSPGSEYAGLCPTCVTDGEYFRVGGTSMAAAVASGAVALVADARPGWSPDQIKGSLMRRSRPVRQAEAISVGVLVDGANQKVEASVDLDDTITGGEIAIDKVLRRWPARPANEGVEPNELIDPATGGIDYTRASWSRASWSDAVDPLRASWSRASWSRASWSRASWSATELSCSDFERASWSRASWSRASWSAEDIANAEAECAALEAAGGWERASWSRASWSRASWSADVGWASSFTK